MGLTWIWHQSDLTPTFAFNIPWLTFQVTMAITLICWYSNKRPVGLSSFVNCPPVVASFLTQRQLSVIAGWQHMGRVPHPYYINPGYGLSLVDTLWNASSYRQPLEQEGDPMTWIEKFWLQISLIVTKEVINVPPVPSISRCIHIVYRHKNVWEYQWSNFIYNCMSTFLHYVHCKDALLDCSAPGGERCESQTWVMKLRRPRMLRCHCLPPGVGCCFLLKLEYYSSENLLKFISNKTDVGTPMNPRLP